MISNESPKTDRQIITALASAADLPPFDFLQRTRVLRMRIFSTELLVKPWPWHAPPCGHTICGTATIRCLSLNMFGRRQARFCCIHWQPLSIVFRGLVTRVGQAFVSVEDFFSGWLLLAFFFCFLCRTSGFPIILIDVEQTAEHVAQAGDVSTFCSGHKNRQQEFTISYTLFKERFAWASQLSLII